MNWTNFRFLCISLRIFRQAGTSQQTVSANQLRIPQHSRPGSCWFSIMCGGRP